MIAYDPARFMDVGNVDEAINIILCPTEDMTAEQRWRDEAPVLMRIMEPHIPREGMVLDYGCGIGRLAKPLIEKFGCSVIGVDISANMRAMASSSVNSPRFAAISPEMFDALFEEAKTNFPVKFGAAIAVWVLQHCMDLKESIGRIHGALRDGGKLFIVNNNERCVPIEGDEWVDDGLNIRLMILNAGFTYVEGGALDESVAPGWMQQGTFWAVYEKR